HNIPLAFSNHLNPLLPDIFPDSQIAKQYSSAATKMTCLINGAIAPYFREKLVEIMKNSPYSLLIDDSNDTDLEKMNPLTVRMFDIDTQRVESRLLDMCATTGKDSVTAAASFDKIDQALDMYFIPWANYMGFGVDNTSVNLGNRNSIMTRVKEKNAACYFCPCHLIYNMVCKSASSFTQLSGFDVEDLCVDLFYYFDKSMKRKSMLVEVSEFCDVKYRQAIKHVSTYWLSLETAVQQNLCMYPALKSYFLSNSESLPCFKCLKTQFADPILLFYNAVLPTFTILNKYLQREDPCIFGAHDQIQDFVKRVLGKFVSIRNIREASYVENVQFERTKVGLVTKRRLQKLYSEGNIEPTQRSMFFKAVQQFYVTAIKESIAKLPLDDNVLKHSRFLDFFSRGTNVEFFVNTYSDLLLASPQDVEKLQEEFVDYQLLKQTDIPESIWMDVIWGHLSSLKMTDVSLKFGRISKVAKTVLVLPQNAGEERVLKQTPFRSSLNVDGTLTSLITIKLANQELGYNFEPAKEVLTKAKKATWKYNNEHTVCEM
uniref:DUF4371 domain-containing protein n=1 Tax=Latimeria chalumnae TaxID=7897 RepID=H2ZY73_LATCH